MKKTLALTTAFLCVLILSQCSETGVAPKFVDVTTGGDQDLSSKDSNPGQKSIGCDYNYSSPNSECTGGVREWKGGCLGGDGMRYGGVPWSGNAAQWYSNAGAARQSYRAYPGSIIVFSASSYNHWFGHVGVVTSPYNAPVTFKSRNWKTYDYTASVQEYLNVCGCSVVGYINYW